MPRDHRRRPQVDRGREVPVPTAQAPTAADRLLAMQRTAGNHAVVTMLAREAAAPTPEAAPASEKAESSFVMDLYDKDIGVLALQSLSTGDGRPSRGAGDRGPESITVVIATGSHSAALMGAAADGRVFPKVEIRLLRDGKPFYVYRMEKVMFTSMSPSSGLEPEPTDALTLGFESLKVEFVGQQAQGG